MAIQVLVSSPITSPVVITVDRDDSVCQLRSAIAGALAVKEELLLIKGGRVLTDESCLSDYNIHELSEINATFRLRGGAKKLFARSIEGLDAARAQINESLAGFRDIIRAAKVKGASELPSSISMTQLRQRGRKAIEDSQTS